MKFVKKYGDLGLGIGPNPQILFFLYLFIMKFNIINLKFKEVKT